jgi:endonuclease/exonuclease/phosphatase family metal-dependent hydrolase
MNNPEPPEKFLLKLNRLINPEEWRARLLGLSKSQGTSSAPGLVMIQIDGLALNQLKRAVDKKETPFLESLLKNQQYRLYPHYPGLPCATPSIQGELFYGVKQCVPAFFFFDKQSRKIFRMFDGEAVEAMEQRLKNQGHGLLAGGSSYSNIFTGGAKESHFCAGALGWDKIWKDVNPVNLLLLASTHFPALLRMTVLFLWEIALAAIDLIYGLLKKEDVLTEIKFVPIRASLCILLRELITLGAKIDIARGLPIIHLNFIGYDEQAHRRGPFSKTAHWALKGIDASIAGIYHAAAHSTRRDYDVWIYSDHGQEETISYAAQYGKTVNEAVAEVFDKLFSSRHPSFNGYHFLRGRQPLTVKRHDQKGVQLHRARYLGGVMKKLRLFTAPAEDREVPPDLVVTAIGPVGHVYVFHELSLEEKRSLAREMVRSARIPLVLIPEAPGQVRAWNESGEFTLPEQMKEILNRQHAYLHDVTQDLVDMCHHPNAGTLIICGWRANGQSYSFPFENGAHAGPGPAETDAFALLPLDVAAASQDRPYLRTMDLREAALRLLKRRETRPERLQNIPPPPAHPFPSNQTIRIMTYNVHSCMGMDNKISPQRIARIIGRYEPDIVALQELDLKRPRTGGLDQPHFIARELKMIYHFHPSFKIEEEQYGNAVLSRFPIKVKNAGTLPSILNNSLLEPRGALWVDINIAGRHLQFINTHLSLFQREGVKQVKALMGDDWLSHPECAGSIVLCGDFNAPPSSSLCRHIKNRLRDAQETLPGHQPKATWFSHYPVSRIDHVFVSGDIAVVGVQVAQGILERHASDHLPLIVDIKL